MFLFAVISSHLRVKSVISIVIKSKVSNSQTLTNFNICLANFSKILYKHKCYAF
jgi:hypothetical protein